MKLQFKRDWATKLRDDIGEPDTVGPISNLSEIMAEHARSEAESQWERFPLKDIDKLGWLSNPLKDLGEDIRTVVKNYLQPLVIPNTSEAYFRRNDKKQGDLEQLKSWLWLTRIQTQATTVSCSSRDPQPLSVKETVALGQELVKLSVFEDGPSRAIDFLSEHGIILVVERALPGSYIDGAAFLGKSGNPVIGMALRFDRIDYFWFTLLHEFIHAVRHVYETSSTPFVENLDDVESSRDSYEKEANALASECLIPRVFWRRSDAFRSPSKDSIIRSAKKLNVHPAIIAGRLRRDTDRYDRFTELVGQNQVRPLFQSIKWEL